MVTAVVAATICAVLGTTAAHAVEPLQQHDVVLLQPGKVLERRVAGVDTLADYIRAIGAAASAAMQAHPAQIPAAGFIVIAVKPTGASRSWLDFKPALADATSTDLTRAVEAVARPAVTGGPIVFALRVSAWGARAPASYAPAPTPWRAAAKAAGHPLATDALIEAVWPDDGGADPRGLDPTYPNPAPAPTPTETAHPEK